MRYRPRYRMAAFAMAILEISAYATMAVGLGVVIWSFASGGLIVLSGGELTLLSRLIATLPGLGILLLGFYFLVFVQQSRANVDLAETTRELVYLLKKAGFGDTDAADSRAHRRSLRTAIRALRQA